jgi:hypothetical protein
MKKSCRDPDYFKNYAGSGKSYNQVWNQYSYSKEVVELFKKSIYPQSTKRIKKILVLGAATGKILPNLHKGFGANVWGCEINSWAHSQIPISYRRKIRNCDMKDYAKNCIKNKKHFDLSFSNSLIYLPKKDIPRFLKDLAQITKYLHFNSSLKGHACPDPYRKTLESYAWWKRQFKRAGFEEVKVKGIRKTYLWLNDPKARS